MTDAPETSASVPATPPAVELGPDGERARLVLTLTAPGRTRQLVLFSTCLRLHSGGAPEEVPLSQVTHASVQRKRPWTALVVALCMGVMAFFQYGNADAGVEVSFAVLVGVMALYYALTHLGGGSLELRVGGRILTFPLTAAALADADQLAALIHAHNPTTGRPALTIPRLLEEALADLFSSDARLAARLRTRLKLQGTVGDIELVPNALRVTRRMAAWNLVFALGLPLLCLLGLQWQWPTALVASLLRAVVVSPVACVLGLVLQARLLPRFKDWLVG